MSKSKLPIIIAVVVLAAVGGLFATGKLGSQPDPNVKHMVEPIPLAEPFTVLLNDTDQARYAVIAIALQLEPMDQAHFDAFTGAGGGGHGGGGEAPGPGKVATYPKFANAIVDAAGGFSRQELQTPEGKEQFKDALRRKFVEIAEQDKSEFSSDDPTHVGPPYHVADVYFTKYIVQ